MPSIQRVPPECLTIDMTVALDMLRPPRRLHQQAKDLFALAARRDVELALAPQGHRLDADGELGKQVRGLLALPGVEELPQLAYPSTVTYPSLTLLPGRVVPGLREPWESVRSSWRTHEAKRIAADGTPDRLHVETHIVMERDVFVTGDRALRVMCRRLREEHGFPVVATGLEE